jgi:DNA polymerase III delta subunit
MARAAPWNEKKNDGPRGVGLGPECRIALLKGDDAFLRAGYTRAIAEALRKDGRSVETVRFDGAADTITDVLDECRSFGLLAGHKVVVVDNADLLIARRGRAAPADTGPDDAPDAPDDADAGGDDEAAAPKRKILERYAQAPSENATLVLRCEKWTPGNLDKLIVKVGAVQPCDSPEPPRACRWVTDRARSQYKAAIKPDAAERLVAFVGPNLARLDAELAKLTAAAGHEGTVTSELVEQLVSPLSMEDSGWIIGDHLLNPSPEPALLKLRELISLKRIDPVPLRWACIDLAWRLHSAAAQAAQGADPAAAVRAVKLWGSRAEAVKRLAPRLDPAAARDLLRRCVEADHAAKTGAAEPVLGLDLLAIRFAQAARAASDPAGARARPPRR